MAITAVLEKNPLRIFKGGGFLYLVEYNAASTLLVPYCTLEADSAAGATTLDSYGALQADFGTSGFLDVDIFGAAVDEMKAYTGLNDTTGVFSGLSGIASAHVKRAVIRKWNTAAYVYSAFKCLGHLAEEGTHLSPKRQSEDVYNEEADYVKFLLGEESFDIVSNLIQTSKVEMDFLLTELREKFFAALYKVKLPNKGHQFWAFPRVQIVPTGEMTFGSGKRQLAVTIRAVLDEVSGKTWQLWEG